MVTGIIIIGVMAIITLLVGITSYDLRGIATSWQYRQHPHARRWRKRPLISIQPSGEISDECLRSIKHSTYRQIEIIAPDQRPQGELVLLISGRETFEKTALSQAVRILNGQPGAMQIPVGLSLDWQYRLIDFLTSYRAMLRLLLARARAGLGAQTRNQPMVLSRRAQTTGWRLYWSKIFTVFGVLTALFIPLIITYISYVAFTLHQPEALFIILAGFNAYMLAAIWLHQGTTLRQRMVFSLLLPATLGYVVFLAFWRPLELFADVAKAKVPLGVSLFVRVKDILRVVE